MAKDDDPRSTIGEKDWRSLQDRANRANPEGLLDPKSTARRKMANENYKNRDWN